MRMLRAWCRIPIDMARAAKLWELAFLSSFPALLALALVPSHGFGRFISSIVTLFALFSALGCFFVVDNIYGRIAREPPAPLG